MEKSLNSFYFNSIPEHIPESIKFAETTDYPFSKRSRMKEYTSNILIPFTFSRNGKTGYFPRYSIYYNDGNRSWGLWRNSMNGETKWEKPLWFGSFEAALDKAEELYSGENFEGVDIRIAEFAQITYTKKIPGSAHFRETVEERREYFDTTSSEAEEEIRKNWYGILADL